MSASEPTMQPMHVEYVGERTYDATHAYGVCRARTYDATHACDCHESQGIRRGLVYYLFCIYDYFSENGELYR